MPYSVQFAGRRAERDLLALPAVDAARVRAAIDGLKENPRPSGVRKLRGTRAGYRIRVGDFRIIYRLEDATQTVWISEIARRNERTHD